MKQTKFYYFYKPTKQFVYFTLREYKFTSCNEINLLDEFDPMILYSAKNIIEEELYSCRVNNADYELKECHIAYIL